MRAFTKFLRYYAFIRGLITDRACVEQQVIVVDNAFSDCTSQFDFLFASGLMPPHSTTVLCRFRATNALAFISHAYRRGCHLRFFLSGRGIPQFRQSGLVVYPFNGQLNYRTMLQRQCLHVFVGHGDSNKRASVNPMLRAYDFVVVAGELAKCRLKHAGIMVNQDRLLAIGKRLLAGTHAEAFTCSDSDPRRYILYCPTWEGGNDNENYCSIDTALSRHVLMRLSRMLACPLLIDCHPNLGGRIKAYRRRFSRFVAGLRAAGVEVHINRPRVKAKALKWLHKVVSDGALKSDGSASVFIQYAVTDISAMEMHLAARGIPSLTIGTSTSARSLDPRYLELRGSHFISIEERFDTFTALVGSDWDRVAQARFRERALKGDLEIGDARVAQTLGEIVMKCAYSGVPAVSRPVPSAPCFTDFRN